MPSPCVRVTKTQKKKQRWQLQCPACPDDDRAALDVADKSGSFPVPLPSLVLSNVWLSAAGLLFYTQTRRRRGKFAAQGA